MSIHRSVLCGLALCVAIPAEAGVNIFWKFNAPDVTGSSQMPGLQRVVAVVGDDGTATSVTASVKSDAGDEDLTLVESDAYLHGAATIKTLPKTDATLTLTLYDKGSASLMSFSGTLGTDGEVTLTADETKDTGGDSACALKTGCTGDTTDTSATRLDIDVLAAEVFGASGAYELGIDLAGADTYEVAYATFVVSESTEVTTCTKGKECTATGSTTTTTAEVDWDEIGAVWVGELSVEPEGVINVKVTSYDAEGKKLESSKVALGVPWLDGGEGINVLGVDEDPLTTVGLLAHFGSDQFSAGHVRTDRLVVNSSGWTLGDSLPVEAEVELTDGDTIVIPVNSYQRIATTARRVKLSMDWMTASVVIEGRGILLPLSPSDLYFGNVSSMEPVCSGGACASLVELEDGTYALSVSVYGTDATKLPDDLDLTVTVTDEKGNKVYSETGTVEFDDDITAVFANEITFSEDPIGLDVSGKVSLLGAADKKGNQKTLAKGKFYGSFSRDGDGDLNLAGADKGDIQSKGDILIGGEPIDFELTTDDNGDGVLNPPPVSPVVFGNGSGTKNAASQTSTKPELL